MDSPDTKAFISNLSSCKKEDYSNYYEDEAEYLIRYDKFISKLLRKWMQPEGKALDIGAFIGRFCSTLDSAGFEAYGLEPQENAAHFAKEKGLRVFYGAFTENIPDELLKIKFGLISMMESIYYIVDLRKGLLKVNEMLKEGGFFLIQCHQGKSHYYNTSKGNSFFKRYGDYIQGIPTYDSVKYCLNNTGFTLVQVEALPIDFVKILYKGVRFKRLFSPAGTALNKIYVLTSDIQTADKLIILAKK